MSGFDLEIENAVLKDGIFTVPGFTESDYWELEKNLRMGLLQQRIPYATPISFRYSPNTDDPSVIEKRGGMRMSIAEVITASRNLIYPAPSTGKGGDTERWYDVVCSRASEIRTDNGTLQFAKRPGIPCKSLIKDTPIIMFDPSVQKSTWFLLRKGTGVLDFKEVERELGAFTDYHYPIRAVYDLTSVFTVRMSEKNDKITLHYKRGIYEDVLLEIIKGYIREGGFEAWG